MKSSLSLPIDYLISRKSMTTVNTCLEQKAQTIVSVGPDAAVVSALELMRDRRVRAVLVMENDKLVGIITQGDCAIKVLLNGLDPKTTLVKNIMTANPNTVKLSDPLEACMGLMAARNFRHLPVLEGGKVMGVISIGDVVKDSIRNMGDQIEFLETYIKGHGNAYQ
jgi:CBS domain-containing protein